ncbi:glycosyltransferase [Pedobacter rhizosphaerae]|uniref:Glycosyltransferase like family protein n=1 Tax=Pedobacter rhizosphaerae TaxID=390241 RepID=A0A1H9N6W7_9SPHI|nr:glycosyltransferase [Pedobacter rhizosphaerae]SER31648.1 Glycosyltransferase like family protein [Pedobacter rhizosphaerae]
MTSIITCSVNPEYLKEFSTSIAGTTTLPYEIISIDNRDNKYSICEAYNIGAKQSKYQNLCFIHEDIRLLTSGWDENLALHLKSKKVSLVGILGNTVKTKYASGVYSSVTETNRINQIQCFKDGSKLHYYHNPDQEDESEVATLDGMFLATTKNNWQKQPFDEQNLKGFHGYDIDFSLAMGKLGKVVVVYDILLEHLSSGGNTLEWLKNQLIVIEKWQNELPVISNSTHEELLNAREIDDINQLANTLIKLKKHTGICYRYVLKLFIKRPFHRANLSILKRLLTP